MKRVLLLVFSLFYSFVVFSQCGSAPPLFMQNPSFEGPRNAHVTPGPWQTCQIGQTPDTQPGNWGVTLAPSNGASYLGLVAQYANNDPNSGNLIWQEGASQALSGPLQAGTEYNFTIDLSNTNAAGGGIVPGCAEVQIYGGFNRCDKGQLLWSSGDLTNFDQWLTFNVKFVPTQNFTWFSFIINPLGCSALPYVLLDNITPVIPKSVDVKLNLLQGIICPNGATGSIKAVVKGDDKPFTFAWSAPIGNKVNDSVYHNLTAGNYRVSVTDSKGCTSRDSITLTEPPPFVLEKSLIIDANCFGNGGSAYLQYKGGTKPYSFSWDNGSTKQGTQFPIGIGTHHFVLTDTNGCKAFDSAIIVRGSGFTVDTIIRRNNCLAVLNNIDIVVQPVGTTGPFTYVWNTSPVQTDSVANNLNGGTYSVTISDAAGCKDTLVFTVATPPKGVFITGTVTDILCNGTNNGTINLGVNSINPISTYTWVPNVSSSSSATGLSFGTYHVTVVDDKSCQDTASFEVKSPPALKDSTIAYDVKCFGSNSGYIVSYISGGVAPYTYSWNTVPVQTDSLAKSIPAGAYTLSVLDSNNCPYTVSRTLTQPPAPLTATVDSGALTCYGDTSGFLKVNLSGGTTPYFIEWTSDTAFIDTTAQISHLHAGRYIVKVLDAFGCSFKDTFTISEPTRVPSPTFTVATVCSIDSSNFLNTTDTSVFKNLSWTWSFGDATSSFNFSPSHLYPSGGNYNVKLKLTSILGCSDSITKAVRVNYQPNAAFTTADICQNETATVNNTSAIGGGTYTTDWNWGDATAHDNTTNPTHTYTAPNFYTILLTLVSDSGCTDTLSRTIHVKKHYIPDFTATKVCEGLATDFTNLSDTTGSVNLNWTWNFNDGNTDATFQPSHTYVSGGTYNVSLKVTSAENCSDSITKAVRVNYQPNAAFTTADICQNETATVNNTSAIGAGTYTTDWNWGDATAHDNTTNPTHTYTAPNFYTILLTLVSDSGCTDTLSRTIHVKKHYIPDFTATKVCEGLATDFTNLSDTTGSVNLNWTWNFNDGNTDATFQPSHNYVSGGTYNVSLKVTSAENCSDSITKAVRVNYQPNAAFTTADICQNETATVNNTSAIGAGTYTTDWNWGDATAHDNTTNPTHTYTAPNFYTILLTLVSDSGCTDTLSRTIHVKKHYIPDFTATKVCEGLATDFTNLSDTTGSVNLNWTWNFNDGNTDATFQPSHNYVSGGTYNVSLKVTSAENCSDSITKAVRVNYQPNAAFTTADICQNETATVNNTSAIGAGTYTTDWNWGDATAHDNTTNPTHTYTAPNFYTILLTLVSDSGCTDTLSRTIHVKKHYIPDFTATKVCEGLATDFTNLSDTTGSVNLNWTWNFNDGNTDATFQPSHNYVSGGTYNVSLKVTSAENCSDSITKAVRVNYQPNAAFTLQDVCDGDSVHIQNNSSIGGGTATYNWNLGDNTFSTDNSPSHLYATFNMYTVSLIVLSDSGCVDSTQQIVTVKEVPKALFTTDTVCLNNPTTLSNLTNTSSVAAQTWDWNLGDNNFSSNFSDAHTYATSGIFTVNLNVLYTNGCKDSVQHSVIVWELPTISSSVVQPSCYNTADGSINITTITGQTPFDYNWNTVPNSSEDQLNISSGNYDLVYTDANGCVGSESFVLNNPEQILLGSDIQNVRCFGESNGYIILDASGGNAPFTYQWDNGKTDATLTNLATGTYHVTITGNDNCTLDTQIIVSQPNQIDIHILPVDTLELGETVTLITTYNINYGEPNFSWNPSVGLSCTDCQSPQADPFHTTTYSVTLTDSTGCKASDTYTLIVHGEHQLYVPNAFTPNGDGNNDKFNGFTKGFKNYSLRIFNRWGEKVYDGAQPGNNFNVNETGWDGMYKGELQPPGVYVFEVSVEYLDDKKIQKAGSVTLIR